ncbi:MAG: CoA transferase [Coriobacteriaceae bacterium]|jgi:crotonobetainyl-CoA:carnitine CoA-transferase CaiB-like acyl-CoA transferase|nr:CoA transferase [Coriobacteriaceae bacterium]
MLLEGVKILDLSRLAPGPYCTMTLGDMGADVLKVEDPGVGDYLRVSGLPAQKGSESLLKNTASFLMFNRNKRSITLNLKTEEGKEVLKALVKEYDVVVEQFRPGVMAKMGLGYEDLKAINPQVIYCSITGYGQTGPYAQAAGHDINYLALSGVLDANCKPGESPTVPNVYLGDLVGGGLWATIGILGALYHRQQTGKGQYLDVSMCDGLVSALNLYTTMYFTMGRLVPPVWRACYNVYETKDGRFITVAASEGKFWKHLCEVLGKPEFIPRAMEPVEGQREMYAAFAEIFKGKTRDEWDAIMDEETTYAPVLNLEEVFASENCKARDMYWELDHPEGPVKTIATPVKFNDDPVSARSLPPLMGQHTEEVLAALGYDEAKIASLKEKGVI